MKCNVQEIQNFLVIHVVGDLTNSEHIEILTQEIDTHVKNGFHKYLFNLEKLVNIDLDGVDVFISCLADVEEHGGGVYILVEEASVLENLQSVGLDKLLPHYTSKEAFYQEHSIHIDHQNLA